MTSREKWDSIVAGLTRAPDGYVPAYESPGFRKNKPWFKFWSRDWLLSPTVRSLSHEARLLYLDLLILESQQGWLPIGYSSLRSHGGIHHSRLRVFSEFTDQWIVVSPLTMVNIRAEADRTREKNPVSDSASERKSSKKTIDLESEKKIPDGVQSSAYEVSRRLIEDLDEAEAALEDPMNPIKTKLADVYGVAWSNKDLVPLMRQHRYTEDDLSSWVAVQEEWVGRFEEKMELRDAQNEWRKLMRAYRLPSDVPKYRQPRGKHAWLQDMEAEDAAEGEQQ